MPNGDHQWSVLISLIVLTAALLLVNDQEGSMSTAHLGEITLTNEALLDFDRCEMPNSNLDSS